MNALDQGLYSKLAGASGLVALVGSQIYNSQIPRGVGGDSVVFSLQAGGEENLTPQRSVRALYLVKGISEDQARAGAIADAIDTALHGQVLVVPGWQNYWMHRDQLVQYLETTEVGGMVHHSGAFYLIRLK